MKKALTILGVILTLTIPWAAFAATSQTPAAQAIRGFCGIDSSKLTNQQKADLTNQFKKMMDLKKETINKMVANGSITKEQGDLALKRIDDITQYRLENGFTGNCGMGIGFGGGRRGMGRGRAGYGYGFNGPIYNQ